MDLIEHLKRQFAFSRGTFGPGERRASVIDHIRKELREVETSDGEPAEWGDVVILGLDGLMRALKKRHPRETTSEIARMAATVILLKQEKNEDREWPDWRTAPSDRAIEHLRHRQTQTAG